MYISVNNHLLTFINLLQNKNNKIVYLTEIKLIDIAYTGIGIVTTK